MDKQTFDRYYATRFTEQLDYYGRKADSNKRRYHVLQVVTISLAAILPVLVSSPLHGNWKWLATGVSIILAITNGLFKVLHLPESWINYRSTAEKLKQEKTRFDFQLAPYDNPDPEANHRLFIQQVETVLGEESETWSATLAKYLPVGKSESSGYSGTNPGAPRRDRTSKPGNLP